MKANLTSVVAIVACAISLLTPAGATAAACPTGAVCTGVEDGALSAGLSEATPGSTVLDNGSGSNHTSPFPVESGDHSVSVGCGAVRLCDKPAECGNGSTTTEWLALVDKNGDLIRFSPSCAADPVAAPALTEGRILTAFERLEMPAAVLHTQPKGHETLVNAKTIFYATGQEHLSRTVRLLGRRVDFRIHVTGYTWNYDDGQTETTDWPGEAFTSMANLDHDITHTYDHHGHYEPSVDVVYAADYRVNGGPWRQVNGTVAVPGQPEPLEVYEATAVRTG